MKIETSQFINWPFLLSTTATEANSRRPQVLVCHQHDLCLWSGEVPAGKNHLLLICFLDYCFIICVYYNLLCISISTLQNVNPSICTLCLSLALSVMSAHHKLHEVMPDFDFLSEADLACDVVCLVYDINNPRTFEYCAKVYKVCFRSREKMLFRWTEACQTANTDCFLFGSNIS